MIDLFAGLGGWAEGGLAEGYEVVGFDIERHEYGAHRYPAQLVVQDVLTLHGSQFKEAALIVASPPCQEFSYMAMPWTRAKAKAAAIRADTSGKMLADLTRLFDACFRIQAQASMAAGRVIPLIVENVKGAQPWVGRARWNFGSFYLWGDVPALMPRPGNLKFKGGDVGWRERGPGRQLQDHAIKNQGGSWFNIGSPGQKETNRNPVHGFVAEGVKQHGSGAAWWDKALDERRREATAIKNAGIKRPGIELGEVGFNVANAREFAYMVEGVKIARSDDDRRQHIGTTRKFASAMIAKIPLPLSRHIAAVFRPDA